MSEDGSLHEISLAIGELRAEVRGVRDVMVEHHTTADREWENLWVELRTIKHDYRNLEQKIEALYYQQKHSKQAAELMETQFAAVETRLSGLELIVDRTMTRAATIIAICGIVFGVIAFVLAHYSGLIYHAIFGRNGT